MEKPVPTVLSLVLALPLLLLEAVFYAASVLRRPWVKWLRTARELREPPPAGGMYGTLARRLRERMAHYRKSTTTNGGKND